MALLHHVCIMLFAAIFPFLRVYFALPSLSTIDSRRGVMDRLNEQLGF